MKTNVHIFSYSLLLEVAYIPYRVTLSRQKRAREIEDRRGAVNAARKCVQNFMITTFKVREANSMRNIVVVFMSHDSKIGDGENKNKKKQVLKGAKCF